MFTKILSNAELLAYSSLHDLSLLNIVMPFEIDGNTLRIEKGVHFSRLELNIFELYNSCLSSLYKYNRDTFSSGIYALYGSGDSPYGRTLYLEYINEELKKLYNYKVDSLSPIIKEIYYQSITLCFETLEKYKNKYNTFRIALLHGDLFCGNILLYKKQYKLIDFEYLRVGAVELELAFLLCWDFITNADIGKYSIQVIEKNIYDLKENDVIDEQSTFFISNVFIPMFVALACLYGANGFYKDTNDVLSGAKLFGEKWLNKVC